MPAVVFLPSSGSVRPPPSAPSPFLECVRTMTDWARMTGSDPSLPMILLTGIGIYAALLVPTRLTGLRSFSKMSSFDFAITVARLRRGRHAARGAAVAVGRGRWPRRALRHAVDRLAPPPGRRSGRSCASTASPTRYRCWPWCSRRRAMSPSSPGTSRCPHGPSKTFGGPSACPPLIDAAPTG